MRRTNGSGQQRRHAAMILMFFLSIVTSRAQVGVNVAYSTINLDEFSEFFLNEIDDRASGMMVGVDYWFRLKQKRLEFLPTLYYVDYGGDMELQNFGLQIRATIYPFDFAGDCNCPTFSKENDLLKKGFFFRLAPGVGLWQSRDFNLLFFEIEGMDVWQFELGLAAGLDIGISNLLTISPEIRYRQMFGGNWEDIDLKFDPFHGIEPGIRIGLRFDKKNYGFSPPKRRRR